jgi:hypothetical protein
LTLETTTALANHLSLVQRLQELRTAGTVKTIGDPGAVRPGRPVVRGRNVCRSRRAMGQTLGDEVRAPRTLTLRFRVQHEIASQPRGNGEDDAAPRGSAKGQNKMAEGSDYAAVSDAVAALEIGGDIAQTFMFMEPVET